MGLCQYVELGFHASSLPCLHTFWHAIPTSYIEAEEQRGTTNFGRQVLLSFLSQSSKFWVPLHLADIIARRHLQAIVWSMFGHTWTEFLQQLPSYPCRHFLSLGATMQR